MGPTETRALEWAESLAAQSNALDALTRERLRIEAERRAQESVTRPSDDPPTVAELREYALKDAYARGYAITRPGDEPPREPLVFAWDGGAAAVTTRQPVMFVSRPGDPASEAQEQAWRDRKRAAENELLIRVRGLKVCRAAGIIP